MTEETYQLYRHMQSDLKLIPFTRKPEDTIQELEVMYRILKKNHFELPKLQVTTFRIMQDVKKCCKDTRVAHSHSHDKTKRVCFSRPFLKRRAYTNRVWNVGEWRVLEGTLAVVELLTHEISHWKVKSGVHNKQFYITQKRYLDTLINAIISDEIYTSHNSKSVEGKNNE